MKTNFDYLKIIFKPLSSIAILSEKLLFLDPSSSIVKQRIIGEKIIELIAGVNQIEFEPFTDKNDRINILFTKGAICSEIKNILHKIRKSGNKAAHDGGSEVSEAKYILKQTFYLIEWYLNTYENHNISEIFIPPVKNKDSNVNEINSLQKELDDLESEIENLKQKNIELKQSTSKTLINKKIHQSSLLKVHFNENDETLIKEEIDQELRELGWVCSSETINYKTHQSIPKKKKNMVIADWPCGDFFVDYAFFKDRKLVALMEAKTSKANNMLQFAKLIDFNTLLEKKYGIQLPEDGRAPFLLISDGKQDDDLKQTNTWLLNTSDKSNMPKQISQFPGVNKLELA